MKKGVGIKKSIFCTFLIFIFPTAAYALNFNTTVVKGLSQAYGFIIGQDYTLSRIKKKFPDLAINVQLSRAQFNSTFPDIKSKLAAQLKLALGENKFNEYNNLMEKKLQSMLDSQKLTKETSLEFLQKVKNRSKGKIETPVLEYLLAVQYENNPLREFSDGFRQQFRTDGSGKSQGIKLKLEIPESWASKEGERPHIVKKWRSENGAGLEMILLDIRDTEGYTPSKTEVESALKSGEIRESIPEGANYIDSGIFSLENQPGIWIHYKITQERAGIKIFQEAINYQLYFQGKAIGLMCCAQGPADEQRVVSEAFKRTRPLFNLVLNSIVLENVYN